jgi:pre-mRNA-processing factor SLU7
MSNAAAAAPSHVTQTMQDRKKSREIAEARQSGNMAPEVDVKTGAMINPHNPEFITKRPWYLGGNDDGPSLDHQADQRLDKDRLELSMASADKVVQEQRQQQKAALQKGQFQVGMWVEALKLNKRPYKICQIIKIAKNGTLYDLKFEDGSLEHKVKFKPSKKVGLMDKPRIRITKMGARSTELDPAVYGKATFDSRRDKYHGYDVETHTQRVEKVYQERDELRRKLRKEKQTKEAAERAAKGGNGSGDNQDNQKKDANSDSDSDLDSDAGSDDDSDDEFVQRDEDDKVHTSRLARQGGVGGAQMKVTARNLRIREDTAKYLRNLDLNSAYYDPKSRSMRDNPNPEIAPEESQFAGDNFTRISGDAVQLADTQLFAWDAAEKGVSELHPQANPSQAELLKKKFQSKSADLKLQRKKKVLDKYGGAEYLDGSGGLANAVEDDDNDGETKQKTIKGASRKEVAAQERKIRFGVSTVSEEYSRDGRLLKGNGNKAKQMALKSKYEENVFINGHNTVWGSFFHVGAFTWGYADDHSLLRNSYCTGENGRKANDEANAMRYGTGLAGSAALAQARGMLKALPGGGEKAGIKKTSLLTNKSKLYGEADPSTTDNLDQRKVQEALQKISKHDESSSTKNKRKYNSMNAEVDVTEEDMEAYRLRKERTSDPMAKISTEELLDYNINH